MKSSLTNPPESAWSGNFLRVVRRFFAIAFIGLALGGCQNYRLGSGEETLPFSSLYIESILNRTTLPQAEVHLTQQLPVEFNRAPTSVSLANSPEAAEAILQIRISDFRRLRKVAQEEDTGLTRKFEWVVRANATLQSQDGTQVFFADRPITVRTDVFDEGDILTAEVAATPLITQELAEAIVREVTQVW
ncbi:MAG: LPS assembly lipoprotein LptE [Opitutales bacterium]|nr:LPS assembly lipoprotein LptE [Opitutales bacterium]